MPEAPRIEGLPIPQRYLAAAAISLGTALTTIDGAIATVALPTIARDLNVDGSSAVLVVTVYQLVLVMTLLPLSALGDQIGLKRLYQLGQLVFTIATALCFFAKSLPFLLVVRALQAVGAAAALSVMSALIRSVYPSDKLGRGLGLNSVVASTAGAVAPTAGGLILGFAPWPWVFAIGAPFGLLSLWLGRSSLPDVPARPGRYNLAGAILNMATFGLVIAGLEALVHGSSPVVSLAIVAIGIGFGIGLFLHERREAAPILPVDLLARPVLALSTAGALFAFIASMSIILSLPFRLQHSYGLSPKEIGAMIAPWPLTMMIVAPTAGTLSDRYPAGLLGGIGMVIATIGALLIAWLPHAPSYADIAWRMAFTGAGFGLYLSPNARLIVGSAPRERAASAGALVSTTRLTGQTAGATLVAALLALGIGASPTPALIAAGLTAVAGVLSIARLRPSVRVPMRGEAQAAEVAARTEFHGA
ncbi:DHA2 family multidrug resistance protein-like MFS transporter [Sphingomonas vulcanisoli]|uniref:DHA2 family multidrug resistance protein-like MFS transporter n=1 Tax=Sphingomonas vulcanisoli TaxID=1658060 RepID=A0ABX0TM45_9SPHN|nr:MFS transporter [Sphingomonas vulcanisoli]NIJ06586.1 DHA2 family multidrug resistance protein-like MFS transporter [Sphingomonas vulcanisoli]